MIEAGEKKTTVFYLLLWLYCRLITLGFLPWSTFTCLHTRIFFFSLQVTEIRLKYFDTVPVAAAMCVLKTGFLFVASEFGNQWVILLIILVHPGYCNSCRREMWPQGHRAFHKNVLVSSEVVSSFPFDILSLGCFPLLQWLWFVPVSGCIPLEVIWIFLLDILLNKYLLNDLVLNMFTNTCISLKRKRKKEIQCKDVLLRFLL